MKLLLKQFFMALFLFSPYTLSADRATRTQALINNALIEASKKGNVVHTQALLKRKADPNASTAEGNMSLHFAAYKGHYAIARLLIAAHAQINAKNSTSKDFSFPLISNEQGGATPLMLACSQGNAHLISLLLEEGADVNAQDDIGQTALTYALLVNKQWPNCRLSSTQKTILQMLLAHGANPYLEDDYGLTPLYYYERMAELTFTGNEWIVDARTLHNDKLYNQMLHHKVY
jgi:ankyrin repeat protein